ncbi:hypothetical protein ABZ192_16010 [Streptomyces sp. NPDC006235]|uniref:hypothetical protein n=1 Tax=Streptomyces sp. NPDC006235 TaxID=3156736 RepID=UPI0033B5AB8C
MRWWGKRGERSVAAGGDIALAVTGDHNRILLVPAVRSAYWEQVRRIAPPRLVDREEELADLSAFGTADSGPAYAWWRAGAWAGKTALLSWFALHPPQGVRIVPFFITARLGAQNDVAAYVDVVLEQLAELAGEALPAHLTVATREAHLLYLYGAAARACAERGQRLVLLVDGLDEDRGVTTGPDAHSIASLLPARPEAGMRVLVAGRLNPPLPGDVPEDHPLRDPAIVRTLSPSPYARAIRAEAERELKRLIGTGGLEHDLLGLVAVARGGLTAEDLAALTGAVPYRVRDVLSTRAGRTFGLRVDVYLLGHEELQSQAEEMLGPSETDLYRAKLHAWAEEWRGRGWPEGTPDYLLRGYFRLLNVTRDVPRVVGWATDAARHDRLLEVTGGDAVALAEIRVAEDLLIESGVPDLTDSVRLAIRREQLESRNEAIDRTLPWAWAALGHFHRAEALALSIPSLADRALALVDVAAQYVACAETGDAVRLLLHAERAALETPYNIEGEQDLALAATSRGWVSAGLFDRAEKLLGSVADEEVRAELLSDLVRARARVGAFTEARRLCSDEPELRVQALGSAALAVAHTEAGDDEGARTPAEDVGGEATALVLAHVAGAMLSSGRRAAAGRLLAAVDQEMRPGPLLTDVVRALAQAGETGRAKAAALLHENRQERDRALEAAVVACATAGDPEGAAALAQGIEDAEAGAAALWGLVTGLVKTGAVERAEELAQRIEQPEYRVLAVCDVVRALTDSGEYNRAEALARGETHIGVDDDPMAVVVEALARSGDVSRARELVGSVKFNAGYFALVRGVVATATDPESMGKAAEVVAEVESELRAHGGPPLLDAVHAAKMLAEAGHITAARRLLDGVEDRVLPAPGHDSDPDDVGPQIWAGVAAEALAWAGEVDRAERLTDRMATSHVVFLAQSALVDRLGEAGEFERAEAVAERADPGARDLLWCDIAGKAMAAGDTARAESLAGKVAAPTDRVRVWARIAAAFARSGDHERGMEALREALSHYEPVPEASWGIDDVLRAFLLLGQEEAGEKLFADITDRPEPVPAFFDGIARVLVEAGQTERAQEWIAGLAGGRGGGLRQLSLATALLEAGHIDRAEDVVRSLWSPDGEPSQEETRAWVALAPVVEAARGRLLAARAMRHERLLDTLPAVVRIEPRAIPLVIEALRGPAASAEPDPTEARTSDPS